MNSLGIIRVCKTRYVHTCQASPFSPCCCWNKQVNEFRRWEMSPGPGCPSSPRLCTRGCNTRGYLGDLSPFTAPSPSTPTFSACCYISVMHLYPWICLISFWTCRYSVRNPWWQKGHHLCLLSIYFLSTLRWSPLAFCALKFCWCLAATSSQWLQRSINDGSASLSESMWCDGLAVHVNTPGYGSSPYLWAEYSFGSPGSVPPGPGHLLTTTLSVWPYTSCYLVASLTFIYFCYLFIPCYLFTSNCSDSSGWSTAECDRCPAASAVKIATKKSLSFSASSSSYPSAPFIPFSSAFPLIS